MDIIEKTKELSELITEDERCKRLQLAKAACDADMELKKHIGLFNIKKISLSNAYRNDIQEDEKIKALESEARDLYGKIMQNGHMKEYNAAKKEVDELLSHINSIIQVAISGETGETSCGGDCSGCEGCHS